MALNYGNFVLVSRFVRALTVGFGLLAACDVRVLAQQEVLSLETSEASTVGQPFASFQFATVTGSTNTLNAAFLPVVNASGATVLENVTVQFGFNSSGQLIVTG